MSIRTGTEAPAALERNGDEQDTFQNMLSIQIDQPGIGSMSISPANRDVALGSRDGLYILDLQNPYDPPRFLPFYSPWEIADVQWSPWASRSHWVVSTSNQKAVVYNLSLSPSLSASPIEYTLHAHTRGITDINWNSKHPDLLATCGLDGWIWSWDLRTGRRPAWGVCAWGSGATQVKWNRVKSNMIASAHDSRVLIWDDRMGAVPVSEIQAHSAKIYGIDWSRRKSSDLITCSLDKSFKYWSMDKCTTPLLTVQTASPVFRARYLPFGRGVLTLPQRSDHALSIWGRTKIEASNTAQPVARFEGAREGIKEFVWRTRGGSDIDYDDRQFQLVTWSKDRRLRLWPISDEIMREVEHVKGAPITVQMTRRNCPDISYRTFAEAAVLPTAYFPVAPIPSPLAPARPSVLTATISASPARPSLLTSSLLTAGFATPFASPGLGASHADSAKRRGAAMMTTHKARNRTQRASDRLAWMEGVKVIKPYVEGEDNYEGRMVTLDREDEVVPSAELQPADAIGMQDGGGTESRSSSVPRGTDAGTAREGGETEMGGSVLLDGRSKATGTVKERDGGYVNLGEEITSIVRRFSRVNFEKVHVAGRTCTVSLYSPVFLRATFTFPKSYPTASAVIELERNADSSLKTRAFILQSVRKLMASRAERGLPSFELALRFLLGDRSDMETKKAEVQVNEDEDDEDDEGVSAETGGIAYNVPPPRRGGAVFGPRGQLVVFFPTDIFAAAPPVKTAESSVLSPQTVKPGLPRLTDSFGAFFAFGGTVDEDYVETDEALQCASTMAPRARRGSDVQIEATPRISSTVHIKDLTHLTLVGQDRVICSLRTPPLESARQAAKDALADGDAFLARVWSTLATLLADMSEASAKALETAVSERVLREMLYYLRTIGDLQVMGVIACLLESHRRSFVVKLPRRTREPATPTDYFNHHTPRSADSPYDRTPLASGYRASRSAYSEDRVNSPRPSWTNLTAFFNHSVLSLRSSGGASGPGSPDQLYFPHSPNVPTRPPALYSAQLSPPIARSLELTNHRRNSPSRYASRSPDGRNSSADGREALKRARTSPNVTFGKTSIALISGKPIVLASREVSANSASKKRIAVKVVDYVPSHRYGPWWLSDEVQGELEVVRLQYAELLYRWGQNLERVEVLKLCRSAHASHPAGAYAKSLLREASGMGDKAAVGVFSISRTLKCSICHLPVTNLSQNCTVCYHSTHLSCAQKWWAAEQECASGCGCRCVESGGTSGSFLATQVVPAPPIIAKPWGASRLPFFA